ncbi:MAG: PDZ domain-containing protein [Candidatus Aminicenantes bacterium]|nr:PDZ domain-containing protein [Candidatus Aminicenantes bacterium]
MNHRFKTLAALALALAVAGPAFTGTRTAIDEKRVEEIIKMTAPSVVKVEARNGIRKIATGIVIDKDGTIVTTALISPRDQTIQVTTADGKVYQAIFKGFDTQTGIAVIQAKGAALTPLGLGKTGDLRPGVWIGVVGLSPEHTPSITQGIVSSASPDKARLNVWVVPGSSGAPVVSAEGKMVGLLRGAYFDDASVAFEFREGTTVGSGFAVSRGEAPSAGMALAIPVDLVISVATDIRKNGKVMRGWMGVSVDVSEGPLVVAVVDPKSPAEQAKIKVGDVLIKFEGKDLTNGNALAQEIRSRKPGAEVTLKIERDGKPLDVKVKLGEYSEANAQRELEILFPQLFPQITTRPQDRNPYAPVPGNPLSSYRWEKRKYIGVSLEPMNPELAEAWGAKDGYGLLVTALESEGAAKKAGIKVGDILLKADGKKVESVNDLSALLQDKKKGDKVKIDFVRDKKTMALDVEVTEDESVGVQFLHRSPEEPGSSEIPGRPAEKEAPGGFSKSTSKSESAARDIVRQFESEFNGSRNWTTSPSPDLLRIMRNGKTIIWI